MSDTFMVSRFGGWHKLEGAAVAESAGATKNAVAEGGGGCYHGKGVHGGVPALSDKWR